MTPVAPPKFANYQHQHHEIQHFMPIISPIAILTYNLIALSSYYIVTKLRKLFYMLYKLTRVHLISQFLNDPLQILNFNRKGFHLRYPRLHSSPNLFNRVQIWRGRRPKAERSDIYILSNLFRISLIDFRAVFYKDSILNSFF